MRYDLRPQTSPTNAHLAEADHRPHEHRRRREAVDHDDASEAPYQNSSGSRDQQEASRRQGHTRQGQWQHNKSRRTFKTMRSHGAQLNGDVLIDSQHLHRLQMDHNDCTAGKTGWQTNGCISEDNMRVLIESFDFGRR